MQAYEAREVRSRSLITINDVDLKVYELVAPNRRNDKHPDSSTFVKCLRNVSDLFRSESAQFGHLAGFVIAHYARDGNYLLASRWCGMNMLRHRVFAFRWPCDATSVELAALPMADIVACVWELEIIKFERDQWVRTAMNDASGSPSGDALKSYLSATFSGFV